MTQQWKYSAPIMSAGQQCNIAPLTPLCLRGEHYSPSSPSFPPFIPIPTDGLPHHAPSLFYFRPLKCSTSPARRQGFCPASFQHRASSIGPFSQVIKPHHACRAVEVEPTFLPMHTKMWTIDCLDRARLVRSLLSNRRRRRVPPPFISSVAGERARA